MLPLDERKLKDRAHVLVREGRLEAAIELYVKLIAVNRTDAGLRLRHAELCSRLNRVDAAVSSYRVASHLLANAGHWAKAHAALTFAVRLSPRDMGLRRAMKELNDAQLPPPVPTPPPARGGTVEIAAIVVEVGAEEDAPTDAFLPQWAGQPA